MSPHTVTIVNTQETFVCKEDENVLRGMERLARKGIPVGCRNGGCGVCKVRVAAGLYDTRKMSRSVVSEAEEMQGCVLACKIFPRSDLVVEVVGKMVKSIVARRASVGFSMTFGMLAADPSVTVSAAMTTTQSKEI